MCVCVCVQGSRILRLLSEHNILRHVMKVPQQVRSDTTFDRDYCLLVKALVPTRKKMSNPLLTPSPHSTGSLVPPAKPKRIRRAVTEGSLKGSRVREGMVHIGVCMVCVRVCTG